LGLKLRCITLACPKQAFRQTFNTGDKYNVVIDTGEEWKKGFSVVDMNAFGYYLFDLLGSLATFYEGLPNEPISLNNPPLFH
jgi:hypothetical protein